MACRSPAGPCPPDQHSQAGWQHGHHTVEIAGVGGSAADVTTNSSRNAQVTGAERNNWRAS